MGLLSSAVPAAVLPYPPWPKKTWGTQAILPIKRWSRWGFNVSDFAANLIAGIRQYS